MPRRSGEVVSARLSNAICTIADDEATDAVDGFDDTVDDDDGSSHRSHFFRATFTSWRSKPSGTPWPRMEYNFRVAVSSFDGSSCRCCCCFVPPPSSSLALAAEPVVVLKEECSSSFRITSVKRRLPSTNCCAASTPLLVPL